MNSTSDDRDAGSGTEAEGDESQNAGDDPAGEDDGFVGNGDDRVDEDEGGPAENDPESVEALRRQVEEKYDFENFGPADMAEMTADEWEAAFDPETWITGEDLLDRVEVDLERRVAERDVFARVERHDDRVVAYSDEGFATVYADGAVEGHGTVLRDVKPTVALCSMDSYDPPDAPPEEALPDPQEVPEGSGELGNVLLQVVAGIQVLAGAVLVGAWLLITLRVVAPPGGGSIRSLNVIGMLVAGLAFAFIGIVLFLVVANARLSDKFRAEEYRNRLRAVDLEPGERPAFLPDGETGSTTESTSETGPGSAAESPSETRPGSAAGPPSTAESASETESDADDDSKADAEDS